MSKDLKELIDSYNDLLIQVVELNERSSKHGEKIFAKVLKSVIETHNEIEKGLLQ